MSSQKIGFWPVFALVTGSQIGSGVFMLPATLAPYGMYSILGWFISACGAIALAIVFASLCANFPKTGGPHAYVGQAFGPRFAFFTGWTYWVISWVSTTAVIVASIGYLSPFLGAAPAGSYLTLEVVLLLTILSLNLNGVAAAGRAEFVLTILKFIPLLLIPVCALFYFDSSNMVVNTSLVGAPLGQTLGKVTLLTLWGFIGLESATTPAGSIKNPSRTIPLAIVSGTITVAVVYMLNSVGIMGLIPSQDLALSKAPYVDAAQYLYGGHWHLAVALIASVVCIGTLNAWMLTSGQIALGIAEDGLMPKQFAKSNKKGAPYWGLICSALGILPLLFATASESLATQITSIIDFSVTAFLYVYLICCMAYLKQSKKDGTLASLLSLKGLVGFLASAFCLWILYETPVRILLIASGFIFSGLPVYYLWYKKNHVAP